MKKILQEWQKYLNENLDSNTGNSQLDIGAPFVDLYHVGWKHPSIPFEYNVKNIFTGEKAAFPGVDRPMGNNALYCTTSKEHAMGYQKHNDITYLYKLKFPTSELAGRLNPDFGASEKVQKMYIDKWESGEYGARFQDLRKTSAVLSSIEVAIYNMSLIEVIEVTPLFEEADAIKFFEENNKELDFLEEMVESFVKFGNFSYDLSGFGTETTTPEEEAGAFEEMEKMLIKGTMENSKLLAAKDIIPTETENFIKRFMKIKQKFENLLNQEK